jgi:hypothetical protein
LGKGNSPRPPDPAELARTQTQTNLDTAIANNRMGMVDQVNPYGSLTYETIYDQPQQTAQPAAAAPSRPQMRERYNEATGKYEFVPVGGSAPSSPSTGATSGMNVPRYRATTTLSPEQQRLFDLQNKAQTNFGQLAVDQSARLGSLLGQPVNLNNEATEARLMQLGRSRLDPALERRRESLRTTLSNQGIKEGSTAFDRAMSRSMEGENDAYNQLLLSGRQQAVSEALAERNQPINEITALMGGSQVTQPQFQNIPTSTMPTVDRAGMEMANYGAEVDRFNSRPNPLQMMGGLFGLATGGINPTSFLGRAMTPRPERYAQYGGGR